VIPSVFEGGSSAIVGDAVELLAYYTGPVKTAFYEDLLGTKLAESPEDAAMLDIVWDTQVTDVAIVTADLQGMTNLLYMAPNLCIEGVEKYSSYLKMNTKLANKALKNFFNPREKK
jgi:hypothetical protein